MKWFVRGDLDGFFGLFIDNLLQLLLISTLCPLICGIPAEFVARTILPGAAVSILIGNLFYAWQARRLAARTGRADVTALPYGINTVSLIAYVFFIMGPVYRETGDAMFAWKIGLVACLLSGVMETLGAFVGDLLRRVTPRAAMLSTLAGIAITFIAMGFVFQMFASPVVAIIPMLLILATYGGKLRFPLDLPGGLVAILVGAALAWGGFALGVGSFRPGDAPVAFGFCPPLLRGLDALGLLAHPAAWKYAAVILPMGLFNVIGSLQCLESAEAAGDRYETRSSLLANGVGTIAAALFGSAFPTTLYIGHPGWKAMGARAGYSALNGLVIALLCVAGGVTAVLRIVPLEAALGILLWIGVIITAQAFQSVPKPHALAVAVGLIPSLAAWAVVLIETALRAAGTPLAVALPKFGNELYLRGAIALSQGFLLSSMVFAAIVVFLVERRFAAAAAWTFAAALLSAVGLIHAYEITPAGVVNHFGWLAAPEFAFSYALGALALWFVGRWARPDPDTSGRER